MGVPNGVDVVAGRPSSELECADGEGCHLISSYMVMGTVAGRAGGASLGDSEGGKPFYVRCPPLGGVHVHKSGGLDWFGFAILQDSHQPHRHHPSLHGTVRTGQSRAAVGVLQDSMRSEGFDSGHFFARCGVFVSGCPLRRRLGSQWWVDTSAGASAAQPS